MGNQTKARMDRVSDEVAKLFNKVVALDGDVQGGIRVEDKEFVVLIELLMMQILKLDEIEAEGELKVQRKREVCRVQSIVVRQTEGEKPRHEPLCNPTGVAFATVQKSMLFFSSKDFNDHSTTVGTV